MNPIRDNTFEKGWNDNQNILTQQSIIAQTRKKIINIDPDKTLKYHYSDSFQYVYWEKKKITE